MISRVFSLEVPTVDDAELLPRRAPSAFVAGPENALVRVIAEALNDTPAKYSPVVVYGPTGVGKSALLHALVALQPSRAALLISGVDFARAFANAIETDSVDDLRERYDRLELLAIDDVHRLKGKPAAQQELLHVLDRLERNDATVLASLRSSPRDTHGLLPGLVSRLSGGLVVPLALPQAAARRQIVAQLAEAHYVALPDEVIERLADPSPGRRTPFATAPQLRQAVAQLARQAERTTDILTMSSVTALAAEHSPDAKTIHRQVLIAVARQHQITVADLKGPSRQQSLVQARGLAMHLCRELSGASYAAIGKLFGNRDHTTVMHACRRTELLLATDPLTRDLADRLLSQVMNDSASPATEVES